MERCRTLQDYATFVDLVRWYVKELPLKQAVEKAIRECIDRDILAEFLRCNRAEVLKMSIYEYDEEKHMQQERTDAKEEGARQTLELLNRLNHLLAEQDRTDDIMKAALDLEYQKKLLEEFELI